MNGIVTPPPNTDSLTPDTPAGPDDLIRFDGWWPAISLSTLRDAEKIHTDIPGARLRATTKRAMLDVARELTPWRLARQAEGYDKLEDVPARQTLDDESDYLILWRHAVQSVAAADLNERSLTQSSMAPGQDRTEQALSQAERQLRNVRFAVRDFLGVGRIDVALI